MWWPGWSARRWSSPRTSWREHLLPVALPTGVVTGLIGAPYLVWLLATTNREGRGG